MDSIVSNILEKGLVGGCFTYLLFMFVNRFNVTLEKISDTLLTVSHTLTSMDARMQNLENRVNKLEGEK